MTPRIIRIVSISAVVVILLVASFFLHDLGRGHRTINTAGKIVFVSDRNSPGYLHIWIMNADGSQPQELTTGSENDTDPAFSPDGSQIAFVSDRGGQSEIYIMDADGANPHAMTIGSDSKSDPAFSPDGSLLGFLTRGTLTTIDLSSNETTPQLPSPSSATATDTSVLSRLSKFPVTRYMWKPLEGSGRQSEALAAIQESDTGDEEVVTLLPKLGANPLTLLEAADISLTWSPDGSTLAVAAIGSSGPANGKTVSGLILYDPNGRPLPLPFPPSPGQTTGPQNPVFSADGSQIACEVWQQANTDKRRIAGIAIAPANGSEQPHVLVQGPATGLQWSPDGGHLLYLTAQGAKHDIWSMDPDGTNRVDLTQGQGDCTEASWSPALPKTGS